MASHCLAAALKRSQQAPCRLPSPVDQRAAAEAATSALRAQRRNDKVIRVPVRPWHSPCRLQQRRIIAANSPSSFSFNCGDRDEDDEDGRSSGTVAGVSDSISQDPGMTHNFLCTRVTNCSNSSKRHHRHRHQRLRQPPPQPQPQSQSWTANAGGEPTCLNWGCRLNQGGAAGLLGDQHCRTSCHRTVPFSNANCLVANGSPSQHSDGTETAFGHEELRLGGQWHGSLNNEEEDAHSYGSLTTQTQEEEQTQTGEQGSSDFSALTLSQAELSSSQAAAQQQQQQPPKRFCKDDRRLDTDHSSSDGGDVVGESATNSWVRQRRVVMPPGVVCRQQTLMLQANDMHMGQCGASEQQAVELGFHYQQQLSAHLAYNESVHSARVSSEHARSQQHQPHQPLQYPQAEASPRRRMAAAARHRPIGQNSSNSSFSLNQSQPSSRGSTSAREEEAIPASDDIVHVSVIACSDAGAGSETTTAPAAETEADGEVGTTLCAESDVHRLQGSVLAPDEDRDNDHQRNQLHHQSITVPPTVTPTDSRRSSRYGRLASSPPRQQPEPEQQLQSITVPPTVTPAESRRLSRYDRLPLTPLRQQQEPDHQLQSMAVPPTMTPAESRQSSRYARLKTPECVKRDLLSVLRQNISHSQLSRRATMRPFLGLRRSNLGH